MAEIVKMWRELRDNKDASGARSAKMRKAAYIGERFTLSAAAVRNALIKANEW